MVYHLFLNTEAHVLQVLKKRSMHPQFKHHKTYQLFVKKYDILFMSALSRINVVDFNKNTISILNMCIHGKAF